MPPVNVERIPANREYQQRLEAAARLGGKFDPKVLAPRLRVKPGIVSAPDQRPRYPKGLRLEVDPHDVWAATRRPPLRTGRL